MALIRMVALKDASVTGTVCSCVGAGQGTVVDLGGRACDITVYSGIQMLSSTTGGLKLFVQANSSSGYTALNVGTDIIAYTSRTCRDSQWAKIPWNCASATSTQRVWYRASWNQSSSDTPNWLTGLAVEPTIF